jgi:DAK2 domain fusion protein YloV
MREAATAARQALLRPVEGTILSVAEAAAEAAYKLALHERDFYRLGGGIVRAANDALDRTPDQLPVLKEAQVVDSGGAGFVYFIEGILRFIPESRSRTTAFPRRPVRQSVFTPAQTVGENKFCTEFLLQDATCSAHDLRHLLEPRGESLLVIGAPPTIKVHIHTDNPDRVQDIARRHGRLTRVKVDNMERQHQLLVVEPPSVSHSIVAVVPGSGFERIARELGAEVTINGERNPSVRDMLLAVNKTLGSDVYLFVNDKNVALAAKELGAMTDKHMHVMPTVDIVEGIAGLFAMRSAGDAVPSDDAIMAAAREAHGAQLFLAGKDSTVGGVSVERGKPAATLDGRLVAAPTLGETAIEALREMGAGEGGLVTLYYGGAQREKDAQRMSEELSAVYANTDVEYYYGGMKNAEYWISLDE